MFTKSKSTSPPSKTKLRILVLADFFPEAAATILDHASSVRRYSKHRFQYINPVARRKPGWLKLDAYDAIIVHYSVFCIHETYLDITWRKALAETATLKIQFIQDEYRYVNLVHQFITECGINILFTCIPTSEIEKTYPRTKFPKLVKVNTLTGYVPEYLESGKYLASSVPRPVDVGYRARGMGFWWLGALYQEKFQIGQQFSKLGPRHGLRCDISAREEDRLYGEAWLRFLQNCKATLGTESGASVIDWDGSIERRVSEAIKRNPRITFAEVSRKILKPHEGKVKMNQISPRIFEAIGCGTLLVLFEGKYSGAIEPWKHYVPLKKDFSNISKVVKTIQDEKKRFSITEMAFRDIIKSGKYSYRTFVAQFEQIIEQCIAQTKSMQHEKVSVSRFILPLPENNRQTEIQPASAVQLTLRQRCKRAILSLPLLGKVAGVSLKKIRGMQSRYSTWRRNLFRYIPFWSEYPGIWLWTIRYHFRRKDVRHRGHN